jgi:DNA repair protein RadA/Sms
MRARRLDLEVSDLLVLSEINLNNIITVIEKEKPSVVVIDSIQTLFSEELNSAPGSVSR